MATGKINRIMLDNFSPEKIKEALKIINGKYETEASGGITLENIESYAATGWILFRAAPLFTRQKA